MLTVHSSFSRSILTSAILATFAVSPAMSAEAEVAKTEVESISVLGSTYRNTATKTSLSVEETPQTINVIDEEQLKERGVKSLNQALRYTPGVVTEQKGGSVTMYDTYNIRGFNVNQSYYDGLVLQSLKGWNLQPQIDPIAMQQVEVFKGPTAALYGATPPGGMVNMIAKSPQLASNTDIGVATGSRNLMEASIDSTGQIGDSNLSYRFIGLARQQDGQVNHTKEERYVIAPSLNWQVSDDTLINFNLYYQNDPAMGMNSAMPSSGMFADSPTGQSTSPNDFMGDTNWSTFEREFILAGYKIDHSINDNWSFMQNARYMKAELYQENTYHTADGFDESTGDLDRYVYSTEEESEGFTIDNQVSGLVQTGDVSHNLLFGLDYQRLTGSSVYTAFGSVSGFNIFNPDNSMIDRSTLGDGTAYKDDITLDQLGLYFQNQMRLDQLVLIAGGRYDWFESSSDYAGTYSEIKESEFSYRLGALYEFENGLSPFVNYATSFEPIAGTDDVTGKAFKPETAEQVEVGVKFISNDMSKTASASAFHIVKDNVVVTNPDSFLESMQVGQVRSQGLELEAGWYVTDSLDINTSYTYSDVEVIEDNGGALEGTTPIYVPEHMANLWANYYIYEGLLGGSKASAGVRYMGEMEMNALNDQGNVPSYTIVDLSLGYDLSYMNSSLSGASANIVVNNLFDTESYTCYDQANCWYGAERTVEFNVNYSF
jgi:iron complex outermembrane receptor protein